MVDKSNHLPVFCIVETQLLKNKCKRYFRDYSSFNKELFLDDIRFIQWQETLKPDKTLNGKVQGVINIFNNMVEKHAPMKQVTQTKRKQLNKTHVYLDLRSRRYMARTF